MFGGVDGGGETVRGLRHARVFARSRLPISVGGPTNGRTDYIHMYGGAFQKYRPPPLVRKSWHFCKNGRITKYIGTYIHTYIHFFP